MKAVSTTEAIKRINEYLSGTSAYPYFVIVDGSIEYSHLLNHFASLKRIYVSVYCKDDSFPDYDQLCDAVGRSTEKCILLGLGDSIASSGQLKALGKFKDLILCGKLVIFCRGIRTQILKLNELDRKFNYRRYCETQSSLDYSAIQVKPDISFCAEPNLKSFLHLLEEGKSGHIYVKTELSINSERIIASDYDAILEKYPTFSVPRDSLPDDLWKEYNEDDRLDSDDLLSWRTYLHFRLDPPKDAYLAKVMASSFTYHQYRKQLFDVILDIPRRNKQFLSLYASRKELLKSLPDAEVSSYVASTRQKDLERIYYLTDNTPTERFAIIEELASLGTIPAELYTIYPALSKYLSDYSFSCKKGDIFTSYFSQYKRQKIANAISSEFLDRVVALAKDGNRAYTALETRGAIVEKLNNGKNALYWIDALGVEYLGYIQVMAKELGLRIHVQIGRATLPTLTSFNRDFYDEWKGLKTQTKRLDEIKHKGEQNFSFETQKLPIHLAEELKVIDKAMEWAKGILLQGKSYKVVIASDHGASRLAVINNAENKWKMATDGIHSGRCCPTNEIDEKPNTATDERGFWVLANYDRFKGGRKASVEVHGGASLEEVLVPIIELSLSNGTVELKNMTEIAWASWDEDPCIEIFSPAQILHLQLRFNNRLYPAITVGKNKHRVVFDGFKHSGTYTAEVLDADNLIGEISFRIEKRSGRSHSAEEDEFFK